MEQVSLPLPSSAGYLRMPVEGMILDYGAGTVEPCTVQGLATLLHRIPRYGPSAVPGRRIGVLQHSVLVALLAERIWGRAIAKKPGLGNIEPAAVRIYGALHDVGEVLGGDVVTMVPKEVLGSFRDWQGHVRENIERALGLPTKVPAAVEDTVKLADLLVPLPELVALGVAGNMKEAARLTNTVNRWGEKVEAHLGRLGLREVEGRDLEETIRDALGLLASVTLDALALPEALFRENLHFQIARRLWLDALTAPRLVFLSRADALVGARFVPPSLRRQGWDAWKKDFIRGEPGCLHEVGRLVEGEVFTTFFESQEAPCAT